MFQIFRRDPGRTRQRISDETEEGPDRIYRCRTCGRVITSSESRRAVDGRLEHSRTNPGGFVHTFGCFSEADVQSVGRPTPDHSWFSGFTWTLSQCPGCSVHLGWRFEGPGVFFGLILARLIEEDASRS